MRIEVAPDDSALAIRAADAIVATVRDKPDAVIALPTGDTPIATYEELRDRIAAGNADLSRCTAYAVDEFAGVTRATPGTNSVFYRDHLDIPLRALNLPDPAAEDPGREIRDFARAIGDAGGIDLCLLGIGANGHIAFNEPGSAIDSQARVVDLHTASREAHSANFGSPEAVPDRGMTLGIADILAARAILILASGDHKAQVVQRAIEGPQTPDIPASFLQSHDNVTWLLDPPAAARLSNPPS